MRLLLSVAQNVVFFSWNIAFYKDVYSPKSIISCLEYMAIESHKVVILP